MKKKASNDSLTKLADAAFKQAAKKVIERAKQTGTPVIARENESRGKVESQVKPSKNSRSQKRTG